MSEKQSSKTPASSKKHVPLKKKRCPVVCLGASAGGLAALKTFFQNCPADTGVAFVVITHLAPDHESILASLLSASSKMPFSQVDIETPVEPDKVFVIAPNSSIIFKEDNLLPVELTAHNGIRHPIDHFCQSLATQNQGQSILVILSGTGTDGTIGARSIKEHGGLVITQDEYSAEFQGMPSSAVISGLSDLALPVEDIPGKLLEYLSNKIVLSEPAEKIDPADALPKILPKIIDLVLTGTGHDFSSYKQNTVARRIKRRMAFKDITRADSYLQHMKADPEEAKALFNDLLIGVTSFFRDPEAFKALSRSAIQKIIESKKGNEAIRVWVAGCGTGEEPYTVAILIQELLSECSESLPVQVFASDLDKTSIEIARLGIYPKTIAENVSAELLDKYFLNLGHSYQVKPELRKTITFALHNLIQDPPFINIDLVCCRNLLIYMKPELQRKVLPLFSFSLRDDGYLFLGASESAGSFEELFLPIDGKWKIFIRRAAKKPMRTSFPVVPSQRKDRHLSEKSKDKRAEKMSLKMVAEEALLSKHMPASAIVNEHGDVAYFPTQASKYLEQPVGEPSQNILHLIHKELKAPLRLLLKKSVADRDVAFISKVEVKDGGKVLVVNLIVEPLEPAPSDQPLYLIVIEEKGFSAEGRSSQDNRPRHSAELPSDTLVNQLEEELRRVSEELRFTIEETDTTAQEMSASNEELQSMNEELQSTNEELEISKEELAATNEEAASINAELQSKLFELEIAHSDLKNFFASTRVATIFLDKDMKVKRFTPKIKDMFNLIDSDVGRPLSDFSSSVAVPHLGADLNKVIKSLETIKREVKSNGDSWYEMQIMPYYNTNEQGDGAVISFYDISERKKMEIERETLIQSLKEKESEQERFIYTVSHDLKSPLVTISGYIGMLMQDNSGCANQVNCRKYLSTMEQAAKHMKDLLDGLLVISRSGIKPLQKEMVSLRLLIDETLGNLTGQIERSGVRIDLETEFPDVCVDKNEFLKVLENLFDNSIKYIGKENDSPSIKIGMTKSRGGGVTCYIKDNGIGIEKGYIGKIFEIFNVYEPDGSGTGIGLAIVWRIIEMHGGKVWAESEGPGKGSTFFFTLPETKA